jgi:hypothetical protein
MIKSTLVSILAVFLIQAVSFGQITDPKATEVHFPQPKKVTPGEGTGAPSDAIVLFDGTNMDEWQHLDGSEAKWDMKDSAMTVVKSSGNIKTKRQFGDMQLHLEFRTPAIVKGEGQLRGNSGVFFQERYEVQVLDNYGNKTYSNGQVGSIYKQSIPLANAAKKPGEWQTYDIIYTAPRFNKDGIRVAAGRVTVIHNGIVIQNNTEIQGSTEYIGLPKNAPHGNGSLMLQDHGDKVSYRNIWVREL